MTGFDVVPYVPTLDMVDPRSVDRIYQLGWWRVWLVWLTDDGDDRPRLHHDCETIDTPAGPIRLRHAPKLHTDARYSVDGPTRIDGTHPLTVTPPIVCERCGLRGEIRRGRWRNLSRTT